MTWLLLLREVGHRRLEAGVIEVQMLPPSLPPSLTPFFRLLGEQVAASGQPGNRGWWAFCMHSDLQLLDTWEIKGA